MSLQQVNSNRRSGRICHNVIASTTTGPRLVGSTVTQSDKLESAEAMFVSLALRFPNVEYIYADRGCGCGSEHIKWAGGKEERGAVGAAAGAGRWEKRAGRGEDARKFFLRFWPRTLRAVLLDLFHLLNRFLGGLLISSGLVGRFLEGLKVGGNFSEKRNVGRVAVSFVGSRILFDLS